MSRQPRLFILIGLLWCLSWASGRGAELEPAAVSPRKGMDLFERRIRPVLIDKCYSCHSAPAQRSDGGLRVDTAEGLRQGGTNGLAIIPGDSANSRLIRILRRAHPESLRGKDRLVTEMVVVDFEAWIRMGAPDPRTGPAAKLQPSLPAEKHWAFQPLLDPPVPKVRNGTWVKEPLDNFILAKLEQKGIPPAAPADRATWLRRVTFDLIGLPPTPAEVDAFLADLSDGALARVVERLLSSESFGEHWGRHWLRLIGYADWTAARQNALRENAWRYRDYVTTALNKDKRYDDFIHEQVAGDLLPPADTAQQREALIATGMLTVGSRAILEGKSSTVLLDIVDDQIDVTTRTFLGLTVACARCHDHKSDPVSMREYYALAGIFTSTASIAELGEDGRRSSARWLETSLATPEQEESVLAYDKRLQELQAEWREAREMKIAFPGEIDSAALEGVVIDNLAAEVQGAWKESNYSTNFVDRNYLHDGDADKGKKSARFVPDVPKDGVYEVLVSYTPRANRATNVPVKVTSKTGTKKVFLNQTLTPGIDKVFASIGKFTFAAGTNGAVVISNEGTKGFVVVDAVRLVPAERGRPASAAQDQNAPDLALSNFRELEKELNEFKSHRPLLPHAIAVREGRIRDTKLRIGGDPDRLGEGVPRGFLSAVGIPDSTLYVITDESSGRLELANWLTNPGNPLTARVAVNRVWSLLFGKGLVEPTDDFGTQGQPPTHPELLDFLAKRFINQGWSLKKLIRSIALSSTYQMSSSPIAGALAKDPQNHLLGWMPRRPLEPEVLRDALLALSGELDRTVGGPWVPTNSPMAATLQSARRVQLNSPRRSIYLPVIRERPADVLRVLGANEPVTLSFPPGSTMATSPPASFAKDRFLSERIWTWSDVLVHTPATSAEERISLAFRACLARPPSPEERIQAIQIIQSGSQPAEPSRSKAASATSTSGWEKFCSALFASPEFRTLQ